MFKFFKNLRLMISYFKVIRKNKDIIQSEEYNLRVDRAGRIYTVLKIESEDEIYGVNLAEKQVAEFINKVDNLFLDIGLSEIVGIKNVDNLGDGNFLIVFSFSELDTTKFLRNLIVYSILTIILGLSALFFFFL